MEQWFVQVLKEMTPGGYGIWVGVIWLIGQNLFKIIKSWQDERKLTIDEKQANREGFTKQVEAIQKEVEGLRLENRNLRAEYDAHRKQCLIETDQMRDEIVRLENRLSGVFRKVADIAIRVTRGDVDKNVVNSILDLATEAAQMSQGRDAT